MQDIISPFLWIEMTFVQKKVVKVTEKKKIKLLQKPFTKKILNSFLDKPKSAADIANSISFPKEKIYYHLKNLINNDILVVATTEIIKGIEQKKYLPVAKTFQTTIKKSLRTDRSDEIVIESEPEQSGGLNEKEFRDQDKRIIADRRRKSERRRISRRTKNKRRTFNDKSMSNEKRKSLERRISKEQRNKDERRSNNDRRAIVLNQNIKKNSINKYRATKRINSIFSKNVLLKMNGVRRTMTFVHTGGCVTFVLCNLKKNGFEIDNVSNYKLPFILKGDSIRTLPELILNISKQFNNDNQRSKVYLAVHSDDYQFEMTYLNIAGNNTKLFEKDLTKQLEKVYKLDRENSYFEFKNNPKPQRKSAVCYTLKKNKIEEDFNTLKKEGLNTRYNTSMPQILYNIFNYYNLGYKNEFYLILHIDRDKTHAAYIYEYELVESRELDKGLSYFRDALSTLSTSNSSDKDIDNDVLHFLSFYGFGAETSDTNIQDGIPFIKAQAILEHLIKTFIYDLKKSINFIENVLSVHENLDKMIDKIFISGVGSHIKNLDKRLSISLGVTVNNLSDYSNAYLKGAEPKVPFFENLKGNKIQTKKEKLEHELDRVKTKITNYERSIESTKSPQSAKYSLARLEIEKDAKLKSIESSNKSLIKTSKEFESIKSDYRDSQEVLTADLNVIKSKIESDSEILYDLYKEQDRLSQSLSELEYESEIIQKRNGKKKEELKEIYQSSVRSAARSRAILQDDKVKIEQKIEQLELSILTLQESLQKQNLEIDNGQDEINVFEYLKDSIQTSSEAFKRSFLDHLYKPEGLIESDLNTLQQSGYLITKKTKRLDLIRDSFITVVDRDTDEVIDEDGYDIREKLLNILNLVLEAPDNLIKLKNLTSSIIKINKSNKELISKIDSIKKSIKSTNKKLRDKSRALASLKREIDINDNDLIKKKETRKDSLNLLQYVRETIEMIHQLKHHNALMRELKPQRKLVKDQLKDMQQKVDYHSIKIASCNDNYNDLDLNYLELCKDFTKEKDSLLGHITEMRGDEEKIKQDIDSNIESEKKLLKDIENALVYKKELEKKCVLKKDEIGRLNKDINPLFEILNKEKRILTKEYQSALKMIQKEEITKIAESKKTKTSTINLYFKEQSNALEKRYKSVDKNLRILVRQKQKALSDKNKVSRDLSELKKRKNPQIKDLKDKINGWEKDIKRGRKIQERLDRLEIKNQDRENSYYQDKRKYEEEKRNLNDAITRKKAESYRLFIKNGLDRFQSDGDLDSIARNLVEESIALDQLELKKLETSSNRILKTHRDFLLRYKRKKREILEKLKPFGGRKDVLMKKINQAKTKIDRLKSMIDKLNNRLNEKNDIHVEKEQSYMNAKLEATSEMARIESEIESIPNKKENARRDIDIRLKDRLSQLSDKKAQIRFKFEERIRNLEKNYEQEDLIISYNKEEEVMISILNEIDETNTRMSLYDSDVKEVLKKRANLESKLDRLFDRHDRMQKSIITKENNFKDSEASIKNQIDSNRTEYNSLSKKFSELTKQKNSLIDKLEKIEKNFNNSEDTISSLKRSIAMPKNSKVTDSLKTPNRSNQLRYLDQMEKDLLQGIARSEKRIKELSIFVDQMHNEESSLGSSINLLKNDLQFHDSDLKRLNMLIDNQKEHLTSISSDHRKVLNGISNVKDLYPPSRIMLNERISSLYTMMEIKGRERDEIIDRINDFQEKLKSQKVEVAILDQELSKINKEMKNKLENSFFEQENRLGISQKGIVEDKVKSYNDLAQLKIRLKQNHSSILEAEKQIAELKNKESSINEVMYQNEKINLKKIKKMEDACIKLELKITKDKGELDNIEEEAKQLSSLAFNYGDRIDNLQKELKNYKEKQIQYELTLKGIDRSIDLINEKTEKVKTNQRILKKNSIEMDYMANLGLLMNPDQSLNILPRNHKKEFSFYRPNQFLQNSILILITVFTIGSLTQRLNIEPLENKLPIKRSELELLDIRKEIKDKVDGKNKVAIKYGSLIEEDTRLSTDMVSILKFLTSNIPDDFNVTNLTVEKDQQSSPDVSNTVNISGIILNLEGFFNKSLDKSARYINELERSLVQSGIFNIVSTSEGEKVKSKKTSYKIKLVR